MKRYSTVLGLVVAMGCASEERHPAPNDAALEGGGGVGGSSDRDGQPGSRSDAADGSDHPVACPSDHLHGPDDQVLPPSAFDASTFGCYPDRILAPNGWVAPGNYPACPGASNACVYSPAHLPCGTCDAERAFCSMGVYAACNCGAGPYLDAYWDQWACKCVSGKWDCRIIGPSVASCFLECDAGGPPPGDASVDAR